MKDKYNLEQIREYWERQIKNHGRSPSASWSDKMAIEIEIKEISKHLSDGDRVLDIGCNSGFSTVRYAMMKRLHIRGVDYIEEMVEQARLRLADFPCELESKVEFKYGDVTGLDEPDDSYDRVILTRVIINLHEWSKQLEGIRESCRVLKKGGLLLMSEATLQGWNRMNAFRKEWGMGDIPMPAFNNYLDQDLVAESVAQEMELVELSDFSSTYYVGTRVLKPLLIKALGLDINPADPGMEWNRWFAQLPAAGDYGVQKLFVFRKK